jgi:integrative and conjugative element protein (TIGR02256 family)
MTNATLWTSPKGEYELEIEPGALQAGYRRCSQAGLLETGGILIGYYSHANKRVTISAFSGPPQDSTSGTTWFLRGIHGLERLLDKLWRKGDRRYYVGEWHFHPCKRADPSQADIEQMKRIARSPIYQCRVPVLIILCLRDGSTESIGIWVFPLNQEPMALRI